jgi:Cu2+-exporting ATPase
MGMSCASCAINVERALQRQPGVRKAAVNYADASALVEYDPSATNPQALREAVRGAGYDLLLDSGGADASDGLGVPDPMDPARIDAARRAESRALRTRMLWAIALSVPQVVIGMAAPGLPYASYILWALATPVVLVFGWPFFRHGWQMALHRTAGMDTLVALSTGCAYVWSIFNTVYPGYLLTRGLPADVYYEAASVVIAFILLGKWLEDRAKASASDSIRRLMALRPASVLLELKDGSAREVPLAGIRPGDHLRVRPGERIAVDGRIADGESYIDESTLSGEPIPVPKRADDPVYAGTLNQRGSFKMRADKVGADTLLAGIIRHVREAQGSKAPVQRLVDKVASIFVPVVIAVAAASFALWWVLGGVSALPHAFLAFVTVLVIACPCALGLATPTALMVGIGKGASAGIFVKDAASLERLRTIRALVLDKTGTLTEGRPQVEALHWFSPSNAQIKALLYSLERASEHPLGGAICAALETEEELPLLSLKDLRSVTGSGIEGGFVRSVYRVGNLRWLRSVGVEVPAPVAGWVALQESHARTVVCYARDNQVLAGIVLYDRLRPGAREAITDLKTRGIEVYLLTGDNAATAAAIAAEAGITGGNAATSHAATGAGPDGAAAAAADPRVRANLLPADKASFIRSLQERGVAVAMAGDGINDAEALALADVGIAMGGGTDIAMDVAGMTLVNARLDRIPAALDLSAGTFRAIRQNLGFAFVYNVIGIPLAAGALYPAFGFLLNPMIAGAAMALSSITVVGNSLRLKLRSF